MAKSKVNRNTSKNMQLSLLPDLSEMVRNLDDEKYLFLHKEWTSDPNLMALKYIAQLKGYCIEYASDAPQSSIQIVVQHIESVLYDVTGLPLETYAASGRAQLPYFARVIYCVLAYKFKVDRTIISKRINRRPQVIRECEFKHRNLVKFHAQYRRIYTDCLNLMTNDKMLAYA